MVRSDDLVHDYLRRLQEAAAVLPADRRFDLLADVREHIAVTLEQSPSSDEAHTRHVLDRLGSPEELVEAALGDQPTALVASRPLNPPPVDIATVLLLLLGGFLLGLGWVIGVVLLWASTTWTTRDKVIGTLVVPGGLALPVLLTMTGSRTCTHRQIDGQVIREQCSGWLPPLVLILALLIASILAAAYLLRRARRRTGDGTSTTAAPARSS